MASQHERAFAREDVQFLCEALVAVATPAQARAFLVDLCTPKEVEELAQRLDVARRLSHGESYTAIQQHTGASSTTVSRVSKYLQGAEGGYAQVLAQLEGE